jgi:hypothetical protein
MEMRKTTDSYLTIGDENQIIYYFERPQHTFPVIEVKRGQKTILKPSPGPIWSNIFIEIPTRPLELTLAWLNSGEKQDCALHVIDNNARVLEKWRLQGARVLEHRVARSKIAGIEIIRMVVQYDWANREKK